MQNPCKNFSLFTPIEEFFIIQKLFHLKSLPFYYKINLKIDNKIEREMIIHEENDNAIL